MDAWIAFKARRRFFRMVLIAAELRAALANYAVRGITT